MMSSILLLAALRLGAPFSDGMVIQRQMPVRVWGTSEPRSEIKVKLDGDSASTVASTEGKWMVELPPRGASKKGVSLKVEEYRVSVLPMSKMLDEVTVDDILVGEVWFASGQSNMECPIWGPNPRFRDEKGAMMVAMSNNPFIRFVVNRKAIDGELQCSLSPKAIKSEWRKLTAEGLKTRTDDPREYTLSAVAFYFARELYLATDVPIGIVESAWGGTPIEAWTPGCTTDAQEVEAFLKANDNQVNYNTPMALFNGMVADYCPMQMRGVIWYQGCNNKGDSVNTYRNRMHRLYDGWAKMFKNPELKLYFAQLAPYSTNWMNICVAQTQFAEEEKNANLVVLADAGNFWDIHPSRKDIVGARLAMHALRREYGVDMPGDESPVMTNMEPAGDTMVLDFKNVKEWYIYANDWTLEPPFELCGDDGEWKPARLVNAVSTDFATRGNVAGGARLILKAEGVDAPKHARYMGRNKTGGVMYNELSLPLGPFAK